MLITNSTTLRIKTKNIMYKSFLILIVAFCSYSKIYADSIFVDSGIAYKIISEDSVNVVQRTDNNCYKQTFKDSLLNIPASIESQGKTYIVKCIEKEAFAEWTGIKKIVINEGIEEIHNGSFMGCANLKAISIPSSVKTLGNSLFIYCISLDSIVIDKHNSTFDSRDGCNAIIRTEDNTLLYGCKSTDIPSSVETIDTYAYNGCMIKEVDIPTGVKRINRAAFFDCPILEKIHISSSVEEIEEEAVVICPNIKSITVDENNKDYDSREDCNAIIDKWQEELILGCSTTHIPTGVYVIGKYAFRNCINLHRITIPEGVGYIKDAAFMDCPNLKEVKLPSSLIRIEGGTNFGNCISLDSIYIPQNVERIPNSIFNGCISLHKIVVDKRNKVYDSRQNCNAIIRSESNYLIAGCKGTVIVDGIKCIGIDSFCQSGITSVHIPASVEHIDSAAFFQNKYLSSITVDRNNAHYKSEDSNSIVEKESNKMILACHTTKILPCVTAIGIYAYVNTPSILVLPEGIESIGYGAFLECKDLHAIVIPASVTKIDNYAFFDCQNLSGVVMRGGNTKIEPKAFRGCDKLKREL